MTTTSSNKDEVVDSTQQQQQEITRYSLKALIAVGVMVMILTLTLALPLALIFPNNKNKANPSSVPTLAPTTTSYPLDWTRLGQQLYGEWNGDQFGFHVKLSDDGRTMAVSSCVAGQNPIQSYIRLFYLTDDNSAWIRAAEDLVLDHGCDGGMPRFDLSPGGKTVVVGEPYSSLPGEVYGRGRVRVFQIAGLNIGYRLPDAWTQLGGDLKGINLKDFFGDDVAIFGSSKEDDLVMAASASTTHDSGLIGYVSVYTWNTTDWELLGDTLIGDAERAAAQFINLAENFVLVMGARQFNSNTGRVQVFQFHPGSSQWKQLGQSIYGLGQRDFYGQFVSISSDGRTFASMGWNKESCKNTMTSDVLSQEMRVYQLSKDKETWAPKGSFFCVPINTFFSGGARGYLELAGDGQSIVVWTGIYRFDSVEWCAFGTTTRSGEVTSVSISYNGSIVAIGDNNLLDSTGTVGIFQENAL